MTNRDEKLSLRQQILDLLATGKFTTREVADRLGVQSRAELKKVLDALLELRQEGRTAKESGGKEWLWRLVKAQVSIQQKIWRACCLKSQKGFFRPADLAQIVQGQKGVAVSRDYTRRYCRFLLAEKYLIALGRLGGAPTYVVAPGKENEPAPHWNRRAEKRKKQGPVARDQGPVAEPEGKLSKLAETLAGVVKFMAETAQILGEANVQITVALNGVETELARLTGAGHDSKDRG